MGSFVMAHAISSTHQCFYSEACLSNGVGIHQDDQYEPPASLSETYLIAKAAHFLTRDSQAPERSSQPQQLSLPIEHGFANDHRVASAPKRTGERSKQMSHALFLHLVNHEINAQRDRLPANPKNLNKT
jgi:hypothetical protein